MPRIRDGDTFEYYVCDGCNEEVIVQFKSDHSAHCKKLKEKNQKSDDVDEIEFLCNKCGKLIKGKQKFIENLIQKHSCIGKEQNNYEIELW